MTDHPAPHVYGELDDQTKPLAVLVHGFPDTPATWRYLGPDLVAAGYRAVAPWLPGYGEDREGPISVGTYARCILDTIERFGTAGPVVLIGHDWGAQAVYAAAAVAPGRVRRIVAMAAPPAVAVPAAMFAHAQLKRSFYVWLAQQEGMAEAVFSMEGFWEDLWRDWSPGFDPTEDVARFRTAVGPKRLSAVLGPYRAALQSSHADPEAEDEAAASGQIPSVPTLYLHGKQDGAFGADLVSDLANHLLVPGSDACVVEGSGHFLHLEKPEEINSIVMDWLD